MIRMLAMVAVSIGSGLLATPLVLLAQGAAKEKNNTETRSDNGASLKFRVYLEEDWKRWMV